MEKHISYKLAKKSWSGYTNIKKIDFEAKIVTRDKISTFYNDKRVDPSRSYNY